MDTAAAVKEGGAAALPPFTLASGTIEAIKWLAVALMTLDHVNKYLFGASLPYAFELGRIAMPLFVLTMAYNLARPGVLAGGTLQRSMKRLAAFGFVACVPYIALAGGTVLPLNILFLLLLFAVLVTLTEQGGAGRSWLAFGLFLIGGAFVEYWWPALALALVAWRFFKRPTWITLSGVVLLTTSLWIINGNFWALFALPIFFAASKVDLKLPRSKWYAFYAYYPAHLAVILTIKLVTTGGAPL